MSILSALAQPPAGVTVAGCATLDAECKLSLARAFAPELRVDPADCLWDPAARRLRGGYLFAARALDGGGVRIAYLTGYARDCGWRGAVCLLKRAGCGAHAGDSEVVFVDVAPAAPGRWATTGVFLSAHCFGRSAGRCRWFRGEELRQFAWAEGASRGAPVVWVARGKHAHYPTRRACDRGHWGYDDCDRADAAYRVPVDADADVGTREAPRGCRTVGGVTECVWDPARPFRGWQRDSAGAAPSSYARYLIGIGGF